MALDEVASPHPVRFSTAGLPEAEHIARWEDHNEQALIGLRCRMINESRLEATELNVQLGAVQLARVSGNAHVVERSIEVIRHKPAEAIAIYLTLVGDAFLYQDDGVRALHPGQMLMFDADRPFVRGFAGGLDELAIKVPRSVFAETTGLSALTKPVVRSFGPGNYHARTLSRLLDGSLRCDTRAAPTDRLVLDLVASLLGRRGPTDLNAVHLANARTFIDDHLSDPALSATRVAAGAGVSERHLSRVFAASQTSVPEFILARRLHRAHAMLTRNPSLTIAAVAAQSGFSSDTHFSSSFKTRFGVRPSEVRRLARAAGASQIGQN